MKIIGLTGGIGCGKSTAAAHLKNMGLKHIDADEIGRGLTDEGSPLLSVLDRIFGPSGEMGIRGTDKNKMTEMLYQCYGLKDNT